MTMTVPTALRFGGLEAGGTKCVLGIGNASGDIIARATIATTTPEETLSAIIDWFRSNGPLDAFGIGTFGPVDLDPTSCTWGSIISTPKVDWSHTALAPLLRDAFNCPVEITTDVNAAAFAEAHALGAFPVSDKRTLVYITIGTGIGGGAVIDGHLLTGFGHPEMGHMILQRHPDDVSFNSHCPFHDNCAEGLVSGPAIIARWGASLSELGGHNPAQEMAAFYIGQICVNIIAILAPHDIILGGGVMQTEGLLDGVRRASSVRANSYFFGDPSAIIKPPTLGVDSGLIGSIALARRKYREDLL